MNGIPEAQMLESAQNANPITGTEKNKSVKTTQLADRFWCKVLIGNNSQCWLWLNARRAGRYGEIKVNGKMEAAHRISYILTYGDIPCGLFVLHKCDNPICVNPNHLFIGTQADNVKDCKTKNRCAKLVGTSNGNSKLSAEDVITIRSIYDSSIKKNGLLSKIARQYNVTPQAIWLLVHRKSWKIIQ